VYVVAGFSDAKGDPTKAGLHLDPVDRPDLRDR
jgi:hypothetical protein